jgi:predicted Fe-Mo cluster-binding NifX family protein
LVDDRASSQILANYTAVVDPIQTKENFMTTQPTRKIASITDDGITISQHFGRAQYYLVSTVENGQIVSRELRSKLGHAHFVNQPHVEEVPGQLHGMDTASHNKHLQMAEAIADCEALLCRGMGMGAYQSMQTAGIRPVVTDIADIDDAVIAYVQGNIVDQVEKLH